MVLSSGNDPVKADDTKDVEKSRNIKAKQQQKDKNDEMSDEDRKLKEDLELLVKRLGEGDTNLYVPSLEMLKTLIRASTTSMTSVPKPLKFMRPHYESMKKIYDAMPDGKWKAMCADVISVLAMCSDEKSDCLDYRLKGLNEPIEDWGHEYVRHLAMEIGAEWRSGDSPRKGTMEKLIVEIVSYNLKHNAEVEACDLLLEIERLDLLIEHIKQEEHERACLYLLSSAPLSPDPDNTNMIRAAMQIYQKFGKEFEALRCAIMLNDPELITKLFVSKDELVWKQMAILLGRHQVFIADDKLTGNIIDLNNNTHLSKFFRSLARELDIMEPKTPEGIYKTHLEPTRAFGAAATDNARMNIAASFVNGFVNCGFGVDKLLDDTDSANRFFLKNREMGIMTSAASLGLIHRWDIEYGLSQCDRFLYSNDDFVRAGTLLAIGIISAGVQDPCDPASALLMDHIRSDRQCMRIGSIFGLGLAYANSKRETVLKDEEGGVIFELKKILNDPSKNAETKGITSLALGLILVGTGDTKAASDMLTLLMERSDIELAGDWNWSYVALGIGLIFLGTQQKSEVVFESLRSCPDPYGSMASTLVDVCAYAGTGNVLKIQNLLHICSEHYDTDSKKKTGDKTDKKANEKTNGSEKTDADKNEKKPGQKFDLSMQQAVGVLGIGLIAMGEDIGSQMAQRMFGHIMRYAETTVRRAVPLAMALMSVSNPQLNILETLSKYSHDADIETARNAIFAMGLVGAGTNNARLVAMLRQLASYHYKDSTSLMLVRISQGLTHLGKGTMTLNPFHSDRQIMSPTSMAALFLTCFSFLGNNSLLNNSQNYLLYSLSLAIQPRMLITLVADSEANKDSPGALKQINIPVRVGQAVDVVGQAGKPKTITGFQTHTTPVLLAYGERAELATDEYIAVTPFLEGLVILKKNPNAV